MGFAQSGPRGGRALPVSLVTVMGLLVAGLVLSFLSWKRSEVRVEEVLHRRMEMEIDERRLELKRRAGTGSESGAPARAAAAEEARSYGYDVSWPITEAFALDADHERCAEEARAGRCGGAYAKQNCPGACGNVFERSYASFIGGCISAYSRALCTANDNARIRMNQRQPHHQNYFTETGFHKTRVPAELWKDIERFWRESPRKPTREKWPAANIFTNHWAAPSEMVNLEDHRQDAPGVRGMELKTRIWHDVKPILEEWTGRPLQRTSLYGIRVYPNGAILAPHCDRLPLVSSAIINVAQDVEEPWPLEIYDHAGRAYNVTMEPGDMVLYESHVCVHGRPFPMKGKFYANIFVHFEPKDHSNQLRGGDREGHLLPAAPDSAGHEAVDH